MKKFILLCFIFINFNQFIFASAISPDPVNDFVDTPDGKRWVQLSWTTYFRHSQLASIFDLNTGRLIDESNSVVNGKDFSGLTWASLDDVAMLFSSYSGLNIQSDENVSESDSSWAPLITSDFNSFNNSNSSYIRGITRELNQFDYAKMGEIYDSSAPYSDYATTSGSINEFSSSYDLGMFLYETPQAVPEPSTYALLVLGVIGLISYKKRKR